MISIIIPVYNICNNKSGNKTPDIQCIVSTLLNQSAYDFEVLLCDDGSSDDTLEYCQEISHHDKRIRVISSKHAGVSSARNNGIKNAHGEYVTFVDADDLLLGDFLSAFVEASSRYSECDLFCCGYAVIENSKTRFYTYTEQYYDGIDDIRGLIEDTSFMQRCSPWAKLYRRSVLIDNNLLFDENLSHSEDHLFFYEYLLYAKSIFTIPTIGYLYGSISSASLKHKLVPYDMLVYRQHAMSIAAHNVVNRFHISPKRSFHIGNNLCNTLLLHAMTTIAHSDASNKQKTAQQLEILNYQLNEFEYWLQDQRFAAVVNENTLLEALYAYDIKLFNARINRQRRILRIKRFVRNIITRKTTKLITNSISNNLLYLN